MGRNLTGLIFNILDFADWVWHMGFIKNLKPWERFGPIEDLPPEDEQRVFGDGSKDYFLEWKEKRELKEKKMKSFTSAEEEGIF